MKTKMILMAISAVALVAIAAGIAWAQSLPGTSVSETRKVLYYTCPMHPSVKADKPGDCPTCGMKLVAVYADATTNASSATVTNLAAVPAMPSCCTMGGDCH